MITDELASPKPPAPLEYAAKPPWHRRSKGIVAIISATLLIATVCGVFVYRKNRPGIAEQLRLRAFYQTCLNYDIPATKVVYQESSTRMSLVMATQPSLVANPWPQDMRAMAINGTSWIWLSPPLLRTHTLLGRPIARIPISSGTIFLHGRSSPGRPQRLVCVEIALGRLRGEVLFPNAATAGRWTFHTSVIKPATYFSPAQRLTERYDQAIEGWKAWDFGLTMFGGQIDPADASHFTIDFKMSAGASTQTIDGRLMPDDSVVLKVRSD